MGIWGSVPNLWPFFLLSSVPTSLILGPHWYNHCYIIPPQTHVFILFSSQLKLYCRSVQSLPYTFTSLTSLACSGLKVQPWFRPTFRLGKHAIPGQVLLHFNYWNILFPPQTSSTSSVLSAHVLLISYKKTDAIRELPQTSTATPTHLSSSVFLQALITVSD